MSRHKINVLRINMYSTITVVKYEFIGVIESQKPQYYLSFCQPLVENVKTYYTISYNYIYFRNQFNCLIKHCRH